MHCLHPHRLTQGSLCTLYAANTFAPSDMISSQFVHNPEKLVCRHALRVGYAANEQPNHCKLQLGDLQQISVLYA